MRARPAIATLAVLLLAACESKPAERTPSAAKPVEASSGGPRRGGRTVLPSNEPTYLNPVLEPRYNRVLPLIFEGLVGMNGALEPVPVLAASWDVGADGRSITFRLRPGVKWHDGTPFTSKDVAFTYKAIQETVTPTSLKAYFASVDKLETPDDATVRVTYKQAYAPALMTWTVGILPSHIYGGEAGGAAIPLEASRGNTEPVGTGPYKMARWEPGVRILLEANPTWWNGHANLDDVELRFDVTDQLAALEAGKLDFADVPDVQAWASRTQLPEFRDRYEVATVPGSLFRMIAWNVDEKPFDDRRVRVALAGALDRPRVIEDVLLGEARPLSAPFFPTMYGADPAIAPYPFDLAAAARQLDEAGATRRPGGRFSIDLIAIQSQKNATNEEMFAIFRRDLESLGVTLKVEYLSPRDFEQRVVARTFDAAFLGWLPDIADPDPSPLLHSKQKKVGRNFAGWSTPESDRLLEAAAATPSRDERRALYRRLHAILHAEQPYTVLYAPYGHYAWARRLRGVSPLDIAATPRFPGLARWWTDLASAR